MSRYVAGGSGRRYNYKKKRQGGTYISKATLYKCLPNEIKTVDVEVLLNFGNEVTNTNVQLLNVIQIGTGANQRIGRKIRWRSIQLVGRIAPTATASNGDHLRIALVWDRQISGAAANPSITDIFRGVDPVGGDVDTVFNGVNLANKDRFKILWKHNMHMPSTNATIATANASIPNLTNRDCCLNKFISLEGYHSLYLSTANPITSANISTGAIFLILQSTTAAKAVSPWSFFGVFRERFYD